MIDISKAEKIRGWMSVPELIWLAELANEAELVAEVGTFAGRSARAIGDSCHGILYCIDSYDPTNPGLVRQPGGPDLETKEDGNEIWGEAKWNLKDLIVTGKLVLLHMDSEAGFSWIAKNVGCDIFDFVFIDGDHEYNAVKRDIEMYSQLVKSGGWVVGHDYYECESIHPGVKRAVDETFEGSFEKLRGSLWRARI